MADRSSRPAPQPAPDPDPHRTADHQGPRVRRWGPARIAYLLGLNPSTVHRVLRRYGLARLAHLDRATGRAVRRYERAAPGELVHVDIKKLGNIPDGGGHKVLGPGRPARNRTHPPRKARPPHGYLPAQRRGRPLPPGLHRDPGRRDEGDRRRRSGPAPRPSSPPAGITVEAGADRQRLLLPLTPVARHPRRAGHHPQTHPRPTGRRPTARSNASTAPCSTNGPTPGPTPPRPNGAQRLPALAAHLQSPPRPHRTRRPTTRQPRPQPLRTGTASRLPQQPLPPAVRCRDATAASPRTDLLGLGARDHRAGLGVELQPELWLHLGSALASST